MHDDSVVHFILVDCSEKTSDNCETLVEFSNNDQRNLHLEFIYDENIKMEIVSSK